MDGYNGYRGYGGGYGGQNYNDPYNHSPSWGYVIFYLVAMVIGLVLNSLFCLIIKKNRQFRSPIHFFFLSICIVDIIICITVLPFILDSQSKGIQGWNIGEMMCKVFVCLDYGTKGVQVYLLLFAAYFLFFYYRKPENLQSENPYETSSRSSPSKFHKWGVPLAAVIGIGVSVPAGTLSTIYRNTGSAYGMNSMYGKCAAWSDIGNFERGTNFSMNLGFLMSTFLVPAVLLFFPLVALLMQVCAGREPKLVPPYSRIAWSLLLFIMLFCLRAPHDLLEIMKMFSSEYGNRADPFRGMNPRTQAAETQLILDCLVYLPCVLHPLILIIMNPDYRQGLRNAWKSLPCNSGGRSRTADSAAARGLNTQVKYPPRKPIIKSGNMMYSGSRHDEQIMRGEHQPFIAPNPMNQGAYGGGFYGAQPNTPFIPMDNLNAPNNMMMMNNMNNSYDTEHSPQAANLPAEFTYGKFHYVDSARVEPNIAYTPTSTPPKTPLLQRFDRTPFKQPNYVDGNWIMPEEQEAYRGLMPASKIPLEGYPEHMIKNTSGPPAAEVEQISTEPMEIESLENSPGNTLHRHRGKPEVYSLAASPGVKRRANRLEDAPAKLNNTSRLEAAPPRTNGETSSRPGSPLDRPSSRVEITLTGRTRSRQDLCPDVPRSKFEHAV